MLWLNSVAPMSIFLSIMETSRVKPSIYPKVKNWRLRTECINLFEFLNFHFKENGFGIKVPLTIDSLQDIVETDSREYFLLNTELPAKSLVYAIEYYVTHPGRVEFYVS